MFLNNIVKIRYVIRIVITILSLLTHDLVAQNIQGKIMDKETNQPLENVNVYISKNNSIGTVSDSKGLFNFCLLYTSDAADD